MLKNVHLVNQKEINLKRYICLLLHISLLQLSGLRSINGTKGISPLPGIFRLSHDNVGVKITDFRRGKSKISYKTETTCMFVCIYVTVYLQIETQESSQMEGLWNH